MNDLVDCIKELIHDNHFTQTQTIHRLSAALVEVLAEVEFRRNFGVCSWENHQYEADDDCGWGKRQFYEEARERLREILEAGDIGGEPALGWIKITRMRRNALERVIDYMEYMYSKQSPYFYCTIDTEILREMLKEGTDETKI